MSHRDTHCPKCESEDITYDVIHAFYRCDICQHAWVRAEADFDFDEVGFLLEQLNQIEPEYPPEYVTRSICISDEYPQGHPCTSFGSDKDAEIDTIRCVQIGFDANGNTVMRFESTLPDNTVLPNGYTPNSLFAAMAEDLQERGIKLIKD